MPAFKYKEEKSEILGTTKRPLIDIEILSKSTNSWLTVKDALADTGADICLISRDVGKTLVRDVTKGKEVHLKGIVPFSKLLGFVHVMKLRLDGKEFEAPVVIVDTANVHPIFGRFKAMNRFLAKFDKGEETILE